MKDRKMGALTGAKYGKVLVIVLVLSTLSSLVLAAPPSGKREPMPAQAGNDAESQSYLANLRGRVLNNWLLPDGVNTVVIDATVTPNGDVLDTSTSRSTGDANAIQAAMDAFNKSQPLSHLPTKYKGNCRITLTFTSKADPHGESESNLDSKIEPLTGGSGSATSSSSGN
jgi:TonB family protein